MIVEMTQEGAFVVMFRRGRTPNWEAYKQAMEGVRYLPERRVEIAPLDKVPGIIQRLRAIGIAVAPDKDLLASLEKMTAQQWVDMNAARSRVERIDQDLKAANPEKGGLYDFQKVGVQWLSFRFGALLADDMGCGKTLQALASLPAGSPTLVVCPSAAKGVWKKEGFRWRPHIPLEVLQGRGSFRWPVPGEIVVTNYDILPRGHTAECTDKFCAGCASFLASCPVGLTVIGDELHVCKETKSARTKNVRAIMEAARKREGRTWGLTATPLLNRPAELWVVFSVLGIAQEAFGTWANFLTLFKGKRLPFGGFAWGTPEAEVDARLKRVMLRRKKEDVLKDLPSKTYQTIDVEIDRKTLALCDAILRELGEKGLDEVEELVDKEKPIPFEKISEVRAALATAKIPAMLDEVAEYEQAEEPLVVASAHRAPIDTLAKRKGWRVITGDTTAREKTEIVDLFQEGKLKGVGCTIQAAGTAITLTRASHMLVVDQLWTPGLNDQMYDRIYRIGQRFAVTIRFLVANHPLDERLTRVLLRKRRLVDESVERARDYALPPTEEAVDQGNVFLTQEELERRLTEQGGLLRTIAEAPAPKDTRRVPLPPDSPVRTWCAEALRKLDDANPDQASEVNGEGFSKIDSSVGGILRRTLDDRGGLTEAQWQMALQICRKYKRQVGEVP